MNLATIGIVSVVFLTFDYSLPFPNDLLLARTSTISGNAGNHSLIFILVLLTIWINLIKEARGKTLKSIFLGKDSIFRIVLTCLLIPAVHELLWYIPYLATYGYTPLMIPAFHSISKVNSLWLISGIAILLVYVSFFRWGKFETLFVLSLVPMYLAWYAIGFPVTLRFEGATNLFYDPLTNLIEILSWAYACGAFLILRTRFRTSKSKEVAEESSIHYVHSNSVGSSKGNWDPESIHKEQAG